MQYVSRKCVMLALICGGWLWVPATGSTATITNSDAALHLKRLSGVFTVTGFQAVNGTSEAVGMLTAQATDSAGLSVDIIRNAAVRLPMPLNGALAGKASLLTSLSSDMVPPPQLGTNICKILGISLQFIDITIPGLGLNVHVNELSLVVRADRDTDLGNVLCTLLGEGAYAHFDPAELRTATQAAGLNSLTTVSVPAPPSLDQILNSGPAARTSAVQLGKALFWDMQVGSDGMTCASCHHHAGVDSRIRNQLSPGVQRVDAILQSIFNDTPAPGVTGGPDYTLTELDFPLHQLAVRDDRNFNARVVTFDTDDVVSSMGVFARNFTTIAQPLLDDGVPYVDAIFSLSNPQASGVSNNVRRVEGRNAPSVINAVFTHANFWDGRAHNLFNGVTPFGPLDTNAAIWVNSGPAGAAPIQQQVRIANASLASQAVSPVVGDFEMSFHGRPFRSVATKLLASGLTPLGQQVVHASDSVLGPLSRFPEKGLNTSYTNLIMQAFQPQYWNGSQITINGQPFTQMEANFTFFFGLAIQLYESTLISDRTPFDRFMAGDYNALSEEQLRGLLVFINQGLGRNPLAVDTAIAAAGVPIGRGNCVSCHAGPEFTAAALTHLRKGTQLDLTGLVDIPLLLNGLLGLGTEQGASDVGFANIGVRPVVEDLARGRLENGFPLSFIRQALDPNLNFLLPLDMIRTTYPTNVQVDGAFKIPSLRNVELTGPYFHNGGQATLAQVVQFYHRHGDFGDVNLPFLDRNLTFISLEAYDEEPLVKFLLALTDERVRQEQAPFDHPQLLLPDGGTFGNERPFIEIPAVGSGGRPAAGLPALNPFLGLSPLAR
jgi:cytochrome c peroxidase